MNFNADYLSSATGLDLMLQLCQSAKEGIIIFDSKGKVEISNPRACEMFGYSTDELHQVTVEQLVPEKFRKDHVSHREKYMKKPSPRPMGVGLDLEGLRKDGTTFPLEISLNNVTHEGEAKVIAFIMDISIRKGQELELKKQRQKLQEYTSSLEEKVKDRTTELEHMNLGLQSQIQERKLAEKALKASLEELKKAEKEILKSLQKEKELGELKSRFVSMASHEFRTPLTTILSSANLITKYGESDQQETREKHVERIKKSVQNLTTILNDFLSIEKLESGMQKVARSKCSLTKLGEEVIEEIFPLLKEGQKIHLDVEPVAIQTDEHILKNVLLNLLSNASKYSSENDPIELNAKKNGSNVEVEVKDVGIGIPQEEQKNMFGRFFRAANATNIQGTGLGLNIVKKYVDLLNGEISFTSKEGSGSCFTLRLPLAQRLPVEEVKQRT